VKKSTLMNIEVFKDGRLVGVSISGFEGFGLNLPSALEALILDLRANAETREGAQLRVELRRLSAR
jgi:hypothetical protein